MGVGWEFPEILKYFKEQATPGRLWQEVKPVGCRRSESRLVLHRLLSVISPAVLAPASCLTSSVSGEEDIRLVAPLLSPRRCRQRASHLESSE